LAEIYFVLLQFTRLTDGRLYNRQYRVQTMQRGKNNLVSGWAVS